VQASSSKHSFQKNLRNRVFTYSEDGGNKVLRNFGTLLSDYTASHPKGFLVRSKPISDCPQNDVSLSALGGKEN
jgi:hypothetical protein